MIASLLPLHLGDLHVVEQWLTVVLAFGPFLLLAVVVWVRRRQDERADAVERADEAVRERVGPRRDG